jgi:hypothetical protein
MANDSLKIIGPNGEILTLLNLPPPGTARWVPRRKAELVAAVRGGLLSLSDACNRYRLTPEEFLAWQDALDRGGLKALRVTKP